MPMCEELWYMLIYSITITLRKKKDHSEVCAEPTVVIEVQPQVYWGISQKALLYMGCFSAV